MAIADKVWKCPHELNLSILVLKNDEHSAFLRPRYNLFHQMMVDGKKKTFFKKMLWFVSRKGKFSAFLVEYTVRPTGIKLNRY